MPATSKKQRRFMGMAKAIKSGKAIAGASAQLKKAAKSMTHKQLSDFAKTKEKGLPTKKKKSKGRY